MSFENKHYNTDEINVKELISKYITYWKSILISALIFVGIGIIFLAKTNYKYEIRTSVLIKDEESGISQLAILDDLGFNGGKSNIDNEIQVFKSADLIKNAINSTKFNIVCSTEDGLKEKIIYPSPYDIYTNGIDLDTLSGAIKIKIQKKKNKFQSTVKYQNAEYKVDFEKFPAKLDLPFGGILINNQASYKRLPEEVDININNPETMAVSFSDAFKISPTSKSSSVITISFTTENIDRGKDFLNKYVEIYNEQAVDDKNQIALNTAMFINDRLKSLIVELSRVEKDVENFKTKNKITDINSEAELFINQTGLNDEKLKEIETQLNIIKYIESFIKEDNNKDKLIPNLGITDLGLAALINKYNELLLEKDRIKRVSTQANPMLETMFEQLSDMRNGIKNSINNIKKTLSIAKRDADFESLKTSGKIKEIPRIEREFLEIKRQQQIKETLYLFLLQKREETNLSLAATTPKAKVVSYARADNKPVSPKKKISLLFALFLGIAFPVIFIYIKDFFTNEIEDREELEKLSKAPILGEIPINKTDKKIIITPTDTTSGTELFRLLRNNLQFILNSDKGNKKIITVTSTVSGEGKSYVCVNLACTFALVDKKVLIVGLDIRNPSVGKYLGIDKKHGITSHLAMGEDISNLIVQSPVYPNLDVLVAGIIPPNPNELLGKQALDDVFAELKTRYDYIIIDTAPVGVISDTFLINRISDLTLYITREKVTNKDSILLANDLYEENKLTNMYLVLNGSNIGKKHRGYRTGYYYEYYKRSEEKKGILKKAFSSKQNK